MELFPKEIESNSLAVALHNTRAGISDLRIQEFEGEIVLATYGTPLSKITGGHFYFLLGCDDSEIKLGDILKSFDSEKNIKKGTYLLNKGKIPNSRSPEGGEVWILSHQNAPNKYVIYTLKKEFEEKELDKYFKDFFAAEGDCEIFRVK